MMTGMELRLGRVRLGWSQSDVAARVGMCSPRISEMELGRRPVTMNVAELIQSSLLECGDIHVSAGS